MEEIAHAQPGIAMTIQNARTAVFTRRSYYTPPGRPEPTPIYSRVDLEIGQDRLKAIAARRIGRIGLSLIAFGARAA